MNLKHRQIFYFLIILALYSAAGCRSGGDINVNLSNSSNEAEKISVIDSSGREQDIIIDSRLTLAEALGNPIIADEYEKEYDSVKAKISLVDVQYYSFDERLHQGQILIENSLKNDIVEIFQEMKENKFHIAKVIPISHYDFSDTESMKNNNTSAFNFRTIKGSKKLSNHSFGNAVDINPLLNPQVFRNGMTDPERAKYAPEVDGTITQNSFIVNAFKKRGWKWGGEWAESKDYQHFEKTAP